MRRRALAVSTVVVVALVATAAARAEPVFVVEGRGWGHGIGMSQYGAQGFARDGWSHRRILAHYYRGTTLGRAQRREVRVLLAAGRKRYVVSSAKPFRVVDAAGRRATLPGGRLGLGPRLVVRIEGKPVRLRSPVRFHGGAAPLSLDGNGYRGTIAIRSRGGRMAAVNEVSLERYLSGVVAWEMPHRWHPEALKAQAVVARSYALATLKPRKSFDLFADQRSQVYGGIRAETPETNRAVRATAGRVVVHERGIAVTFYHSSSGGRTATITDVWPEAERLPYLRGVADPHDRHSPHHAWGPLVLNRAQLAAGLKAPALRRTSDLLVARNRSGRAAHVTVRTPAGGKRVAAAAFRTGLGLRSTWFTVGVLDLRRPKGAAVFGLPFELRGLARGLERPVIERRMGRTWRPVARVRARPDGTFAVKVQPRPGAHYRIATERTAGPQVQFPVAPSVSLTAAEGTVRGLVRPALVRSKASIQRRTPGGWRTVAAAEIDSRGAFTLVELPDGDYRARVEPGGAFAPGTSAPLRLRSA
jgi:stage II sporulation protein D